MQANFKHSKEITLRTATLNLKNNYKKRSYNKKAKMNYILQRFTVHITP